MKKVILSIISVIILVIVLLIFKLINLRSEFEKYLKVTYTNNIFQVDLPKIDFIYGSYYSNVFCINDSISFNISKSWSTKKISEYYMEIKNQEKNNSEIAQIFSDTEVEKYISSISGGSKIPTVEKDTYGAIYLSIMPDSEMVSVTKDIFQLLKEKKISVEEINITYEQNKGVYEGHFSDKDYDLDVNEIEAKITKIK
ncbi:hypothetical protein ACQPUY_11145 [Clostridium nigeriense]|uniref:hypothetical protein n=1 Tax=Clostridium nigeriense TaxID=1805470 RepID=UPI003D328292